jgi:PKD repeat protein
MSDKRDKKAELTRRDISKMIVGGSLVTGSGIAVQDSVSAGDSTTFYKSHLESLVEQKGSIEGATHVNGDLRTRSTGPPVCESELDPDCGGGGGDTTTDDGGDDGGGGGGGTTYYDPDASFYVNGKPVKNGKYRVRKNESLGFDASDSVDNDESGSSIESYSWDFGDESSASGATSTHSYSSAGTYTITLTVTDDEGATDTFSEEVKVHAGYGVKYDHASGITKEEILIRGDEESAWLFENGDLQSFSLGTLKEEALEVMGTAEDQYQAANPDTPEKISQGTGETDLPFDSGNSNFDAFMPDIGNDDWTIPWTESGFVGWSTSEQTVEVYAGAIVLANVWGYSEIYSEFEYSGASEATIDFLFTGIDIDVKAHSTLGDVSGKFKLFVNDVTEQSRMEQNAINTWDPGMTTVDFDGNYPIDEEVERSDLNRKIADYTLTPGHVYQVGIHMRGASAALTTGIKTPVYAKFDGAHVDGTHEQSKGSKDNINDSSENGMSVDNISISWLQD